MPRLLLFVGVGKAYDVNGVQVQVARNLQEVAVRYQKSFIPSPVEMTGSPVSLVEVGRVGNVEVAHEFLEVRARRFDDKMKMVSHEDKGEQMDPIGLKNGREGRETSSCRCLPGRYAACRCPGR